jgi:hypothetical protein
MTPENLLRPSNASHARVETYNITCRGEIVTTGFLVAWYASTHRISTAARFNRDEDAARDFARKHNNRIAAREAWL